MTSRTANSAVAFGVTVLVIGGLSLCLIGCGAVGKGPEIKTSSEIQPDALYAEKAVMNYGGISVPVTVSRKVEGPLISFDLLSHGSVLETEEYRLESSSFSVLSVNGETFKSHIPLLKFPMRVGDTWSWEGDLVSGSSPSKVKAVIDTARDSLLLEKRGPIETIKSTVTLKIDSGVATPATRTLTFWFAYGPSSFGIVQREFGKATSRKPAP